MRANGDNTHKKPTEKTAALGVTPVLLKPEVDQLKSGHRRPCPLLQEPMICHHGGHKGAHSDRQPSCVSGRLIYDTPLRLAPLKTPQIQQVRFSEIQQDVKKTRVDPRLDIQRRQKLTLPAVWLLYASTDGGRRSGEARRFPLAGAPFIPWLRPQRAASAGESPEKLTWRTKVGAPANRSKVPRNGSILWYSSVKWKRRKTSLVIAGQIK